MNFMSNSRPFGSPTRTHALLALQLLTESYARELARLLVLNLSGVQKALQSLERDGLVAASLTRGPDPPPAAAHRQTPVKLTGKSHARRCCRGCR